MSMRISSAALAVAASLALSAAAPAHASAGNGIRLGGSEGRLHTFLDQEGRYDSNVYFRPDGQSVGDMVVHIRPGLELTVPGNALAVELSGNLDWAQYLGMDDPATEDLSKLYGQAGLGLTLNRRGSVSLEIDDQFRRGQASPTFVLGGAVVSNLNALTVRVPWRPGGGALVFAVKGGWTLETFESYFEDASCDPAAALCDTSVLSDLGYNEVRAGAEARWRFLPRTSALIEAGWFSRAPNDVQLSDEVSGVEAQAGVTGLVTPHFGGTVKLGYGDTLGSADEDFRTWLATLEGEWIANEVASVRVGYVHGLGVDPGSGRAAALALGGIHSASRTYAAGRVLFGGRYALRGLVQWERRTYELSPEKPSFDILRLEPAFEAVVARWLTASLGYAYTDRDWTDDREGAGFAYAKNEAWLRLAFTY